LKNVRIEILTHAKKGTIAMKHYLVAGAWLAVLIGMIVAIDRATAVNAPKTLRADEPKTAKADEPRAAVSVTPERNPVNTTDKTVPTEFDTEEGKEKNVLWRAKVGNVTYGGPTVAEGKVLVGTNNANPRDKKIEGDKGVVMCFDAKDGKLLWQIVHDKLGSNDNDYPEQGVASTPAVVKGKVYYVSNRCEVICADINGDGKGGPKILWKLDMVEKLKVFPCQLANSSPLVVGDLVYVITGNGVNVGDEKLAIPNPKAPSFIAVNKDTGEVVWTDNSPGDKIIEGQWSSPTYAEVNGKGQVIFGGGDGYLYGFEPKTGKLLWKFNTSVKEEARKGDKAPRNYPVATPVVVDGKLYLGIGANWDHANRIGHFWCIDISKEPKKADKDLSSAEGDFDPKSAANKDSGLVWHYGGLILPKPMRGPDTVFGYTISTACVVDGLVYIPEFVGFLHCLDAKTGAKLWVHDFNTGTLCTPYYVAGKIIIGNDDGDLVFFDHGRKLNPPTKVSLQHGVKTRVTVVDGVLYAASEQQVFAIGKK